MHRSHTCWELTKANIWQTVTLSGWVDNVRKFGGMTFFTLRDRYGVTQVSCDPQVVWESVSDTAASCKNEYVIKVHGTVQGRPDTMINEQMATGAIEIIPTSIEVLTKAKELPFQIVDDPKTSEEIRYKHRYLDLRRRKVLENIEFRAKMNQFTRNWFSDRGFLEVQTPIFTVSSPEGSRDYVIPSRVNPGKFYALPQSPQQYKQLLMIGGIDKYFQIAPCFRDEDPRADRAMCEFYQVDLEMSFVEQEDVLQVLKWYALDTVAALTPHKKLKFGTELPRISYKDAMDNYGIDRPDLRFDMKIIDLTAELTSCGFSVFTDAIAAKWHVRAIKLDAAMSKNTIMSRKELDEITDVAKRAGAGGLAYLIYENWEARGPITKFFSPEELATIKDKTQAQDGDILFFGVGKYSLVCKVLHTVRMYLRDKYELVDNDEFAFCFVVDFPFFEYDDGSDKWDFGHNPFSEVVGWLDALANKPIEEIMTHQYDIILNGFEIGGWSIRNNNPEVLVKAFEKVWYNEEVIKQKFGTMYEAFQYGAPPHGGCAFGFDRFLMLLTNEDNIREVYAFPKSGRAEDAMMQAPSTLDGEQLKELNIKLIDTENA